MFSAIDTKSATALLRAFAHPTRLAILQLLVDGPQCVTELEELLPVRQANLSQHLSLLRHTQVVDFVQHGQMRCYYLAKPRLVRSLLAELVRDETPIAMTARQIQRAKSKRQVSSKQASPPGRRRDEEVASAPSTKKVRKISSGVRRKVSPYDQRS